MTDRDARSSITLLELGERLLPRRHDTERARYECANQGSCCSSAEPYKAAPRPSAPARNRHAHRPHLINRESAESLGSACLRSAALVSLIYTRTEKVFANRIGPNRQRTAFFFWTAFVLLVAPVVAPSANRSSGRALCCLSCI